MCGASSFLVLLAGIASANAEERILSGEEIRTLLPTVTVRGEASEQQFSASGETALTDHGKKSTGRWTVEGDRYCSTWPPNEARGRRAVSPVSGR